MNSEEAVGYKAVARKNLKFWPFLHLQDPARFVFGEQIGLIVNQRMAMSTVRRISWEIHRNLVNARDNLVKARKSPESLRKSVETFKDALLASADVQCLLDDDLLTELCCAVDANDPIFEEPKILEKFREGFRRLARKHLLSIGTKSVEMLAKRLMAFLQELIAQMLYFKKVYINFSNIPKPPDFYRDQISTKTCYFDVQNMLRRLERDECKANVVLEIIHCRNEHLIDFVFDFQFQRMFSSEFKRFFDKWILGVKDRLLLLTTDKPKCFRSIPLHKPILADQIPQFLHSTLISLFNDSRLSLFADGWADYVLAMIYQLPFEELEENKQQNVFEWQMVLLANSPLCDRLSTVYRSQNVEEQRSVLANLLRFLLRFTSDLIRFVFDVKMSEEGRIEKIQYNGHFETIGEDGDVVLDELITSASCRQSRHDIKNSHEKVITWLATSSRSRSPVRRVPTKSIMKSFVKWEEAKLPPGELSHAVLEKMGEMNKMRNWNSTLSPIVVPADGGSVSHQLSETFSFAFPTPPPTPDSTLHLFDGSCPVLSDPPSLRGRQMNNTQQPRRHPTPKAAPRAPSSSSSSDDDIDSDYEDFSVVDNNSNKPEPGFFGVEADYLPPYVLLYYPLIATAPDNNSNE